MAVGMARSGFPRQNWTCSSRQRPYRPSPECPGPAAARDQRAGVVGVGQLVLAAALSGTDDFFDCFPLQRSPAQGSAWPLDGAAQKRRPSRSCHARPGTQGGSAAADMLGGTQVGGSAQCRSWAWVGDQGGEMSAGFSCAGPAACCAGRCFWPGSSRMPLANSESPGLVQFGAADAQQIQERPSGSGRGSPSLGGSRPWCSALACRRRRFTGSVAAPTISGRPASGASAGPGPGAKPQPCSLLNWLRNALDPT